MLFNSFEFLLFFLPLCYAGYLIVHSVGGRQAVFPYLAAASLVFYAHWSFWLAALLLGSVMFNFTVGCLIRAYSDRRSLAGAGLLVAVTANLVMLGYFKYANFFIDTTNDLFVSGFSHIDVILPVGISFYTFVQIGYLVEAFNGQTKRIDFGRYTLFATFFPYVTAGPLVLQREMFEQMEADGKRAFDPWRLSVGLTIFGMGLFKKVVFADSIAPYANEVFAGVASGAAIAPLEAWTGSLCYTLQLYFDFSGYSDMAIGVAYLLGFKLPLNFNSPLKATSISDFWRRWHMTMTRFFSNYLYSPLGMKMTRKAIVGRYPAFLRFLAAVAYPVTFTFIIAGIWHGSGWTFIVFGLIHGLALAINHGWREFGGPQLGRPVGWLLTMATVVSALVVFRAPDLATAGTLLSSMWGLTALVGGGAGQAAMQIDLPWAMGLVFVFGLIVLLMPNTQEILRRQWMSTDPEPDEDAAWARWLQWRPSAAWAAAAAVIFVVAFTSLGADTTFLYYRF